MYEIRASSKIEKSFNKVITSISKQMGKRLIKRLTDYPYPARAQDEELGKVTKKGNFYCYDISGGGRVIYDIIEENRIVNIRFAGNHDDQITFLRKYKK